MSWDIESLETMLDFIRWGASRFTAEGLFFWPRHGQCSG